MPVKEKHEEVPEIVLVSMKTVKIFAIFPERDSIFPGELRLSPPSGQLDLDCFLYSGKLGKQKVGMAYGGDCTFRPVGMNRGEPPPAKFLDTSGKNTIIFNGIAAFMSRLIKPSSNS